MEQFFTSHKICEIWQRSIGSKASGRKIIEDEKIAAVLTLEKYKKSFFFNGLLDAFRKLSMSLGKSTPSPTPIYPFYLEIFFVFGEFDGDAKFDFVKDAGELRIHYLDAFRAQAALKFAKLGRLDPAQQ